MASSEGAALEVLADLRSGKMAISDILGPLYPTVPTASPTIQIPPGDKRKPSVAPHCPVAPMDDVNQQLVRDCGPHGIRKNPEPQPDYDLCVIGAGVAGLLSSIMSKALGKRVCMIERQYMGGDCLNIGCFPSKCLIACARRAHEVRTAAEFGVMVRGEVTVDFGRIMRRMRELRAEIGHSHDSVERYARDFCQDIMLGNATFIDAHTVQVTSPESGDRVIRFKKCMIATGASAAVPPIGGPEGLPKVPHLTNNNFFNLEELPPTMVLIGAGPIGIEMAQAMARLGSRVVILEVAPQLLPREDPDAAAALHDALKEEPNLTIHFGAQIKGITYSGPPEARTRAPWGEYTVTGTLRDGSALHVSATALLNATGRVPNVYGIGLEKIGVEFDTRRGVAVDDFFQTAVPHIYSCGDCASPFKFTHAADWQARLAIRNMFLGDRNRSQSLLVPWCTYTEPEIAHVGLYEREMDERGVKYETYLRKFEDVDRCKADGHLRGFCKISCAAGTDRIVGATIVGPSAGDLISELTVCMTAGVGLSQLAGIQHPYPTTAEVIRQCAAIYWQKGKLRTPAKNEALKMLSEGRATLHDSKM
eukprot:TRINITY_DN46749_c0_g1_i1.p1 TRINITY_DN46749_c0_g1~~TRINITY_DN46749_c0_g1_i1.p1  ORF type:complete len:611 (+),score=199.79 TRINITY_DN46749_c0_g1_i1:65-1834(+)